MERIVYNKTLDTHKSGVQFTLQGFETADKMSRRIVISLMASGDAIDLPLEQMEAVMYVSTPGIAETSINACTIEGNTIIYDALPITEEGITTMQLKLIGARGYGVASVLAAPKFAVEVIKSDAEDESIKGTASYTAVEEALSRARAVYDSRLLRIALNSDCMFYAYYADGTIYESDVLKELFLKGEALLAQSYARGGTGTRDGEDTDNAMYYSNVSKSMSLETKAAGENALEILEEVKLHGVYTIFSANFETGELVYESPKYDFEVDKESGELHVIGKSYNIEETMRLVVEEWLKSEPLSLECGGTGANNEKEAASNLGVYSKNESCNSTTLASFGLTSDNTPNTIFSLFVSHWWKRRTESEGYSLDAGVFSDQYVFYGAEDRSLTLYYSDSITINEEGLISLVDPNTIVITYNDYFTNPHRCYELEGKYYAQSPTGLAVVYHGGDGGCPLGYRNGSGNGCVIGNTIKYTSTYYKDVGDWEYLMSTSEDAYPTGQDGLFYYVYLGKPFENAREAVNVAQLRADVDYIAVMTGVEL